MFKSPAEIALLQKSNDLLLIAYRATWATMRDGMPQEEFAGNCAAALNRLGVQGGIFCSFGKYTAFPHGSSTPQKLHEGDVVLIRTGHGQLWMKDNAAFNSGEPGIGMAAGQWLCDQKITLVGGDSWATEVVPSENKERPFEVHQLLLVRNGIYNLENLDLEELARDKVYEFAFIFAPLRLKGATGSPGNPIAVK